MCNDLVLYHGCLKLTYIRRLTGKKRGMSEWSRNNRKSSTPNSIITQDNKLYHEFVECISSALDARDPYTGDHSRRVSDTATVLAKCWDLQMTKYRKYI